MVDRDVLSTRLNALEGYLADLRPFAKRSRDEFVRESGLHHLAERLLHLACECVIDIAHHIIADEGYRQPSTYRDAIAVLAEEGVVDDALADRVAAWVGFRNVLAHAYLDIDHGRSYDSIESDLGDLEDFAERSQGCCRMPDRMRDRTCKLQTPARRRQRRSWSMPAGPLAGRMPMATARAPAASRNAN